MAVACLILELQKNLKIGFSWKKYFSMGVFSKFLLSVESFLSYCKKLIFSLKLRPTSEKFLWCRPNVQGKNRGFDDNSKMTCLRAKTCKRHPSSNYFLVKKCILNFFVAPKLRKLWPFWVQNTNGRGKLNFWARSLKLWNLT